MKSIILNLSFFTLLLLSVKDVFCQAFTNDAGTREKHFIAEVKQVDEFIERYNDVHDSFLREAYRSHNANFKISRKDLIKSLFNYETKSWSEATIDSFAKDAVNPAKPSKLNFYGDNWFAEVSCKFQFNSSVILVPVILKVSTDRDRHSKWMIVAVGQSALKQDTLLTKIETTNVANKFINPASHGNNFIELEKVFNDREHLAEYFEDEFFKRKNGLAFYTAVLKGHLKFITVKDVKYHFLQADNWIFIVEQFRRESLNSGWLINKMQRAGLAAKEAYIKELLGEQL